MVYSPSDSSYRISQPVSTNFDGFASIASVRHTLVLVVGVVVTSIILGGSKNGQLFFNFIYHVVNHLFGGAPHTVDMPGPIGFPLVGSLYQVYGNLSVKFPANINHIFHR